MTDRWRYDFRRAQFSIADFAFNKAGIHTWANGGFPKLKTILGAYLARAACSNFVATIPFQGHRNLANRRKDQYASDG